MTWRKWRLSKGRGGEEGRRREEGRDLVDYKGRLLYKEDSRGIDEGFCVYLCREIFHRINFCVRIFAPVFFVWEFACEEGTLRGRESGERGEVVMEAWEGREEEISKRREREIKGSGGRRGK